MTVLNGSAQEPSRQPSSSHIVAVNDLSTANLAAGAPLSAANDTLPSWRGKPGKGARGNKNKATQECR
jgi:hypothetical protein